jgi:SAM-dependent methyltransferase
MYDEQYAEIYDLLYAASGKDYLAETAALVELIRRRTPGAGSVLDVACGTGEHLRHLRTGFGHVEGVEISAPMRARAAAKVPDVTVHLSDMRDVDLGRTFDAVLCLFSAIGCVRSEDELRATVARLAAHTRPGGVVIVEPWLYPEQWREGNVSTTLGERDGRTVVQVTNSHRDGRRSLIDSHVLVAGADGIAHFTNRHELMMFSPDEYADAFTRAGLRDVEFVDGWREGRGRIAAVRP